MFRSILVLLGLGLVQSTVAQNELYDYIVVGSGPGGGTLASNLARANLTVLLIEAGDDSLPGGVGDYTPGIAWDFFVKHYEDPTENMKNNKLTWRTKSGRYWVGKGSDPPPEGATFLGVYYPRGAALGGSSMINAMATLLPADSDWDYIANVTGDGSWSADKMRKVFQRIEHNDYLPRGAPGHGFDGYFHNSMPPVTMVDQPSKAITESVAKSLGLDPANLTSYLNTDPNNLLEPNRDYTQRIIGVPFHTFPNGDRFSARSVIQDTVKAGFPLVVSMNSLATRVLWANDTAADSKPKAVGVEYLQGKAVYKADQRATANNVGTLKQAFARREIILSGGTFNTPQLLKLSGIGPAAELSRFNIPLVTDLPGVGANLMDNQEMPIVGRISPEVLPPNFAPTGLAPGGVMLRTAHAPTEECDVFVMHGPLALRGFAPPDQDNKNLKADPPGTYGISIVKQFPQSKSGSVLLRSPDPRDPPDITIGLYPDDSAGAADLAAMKDVVAWARRVFGTVEPPYGPVRTVEPPCRGAPDESGYCAADDEDWIIGQTFGHHPTSTARIGALDDDMSVLDSGFRVRGVRNLRVVDASAFPRTPGVFPVLATFMLSQKAADVILSERKVEE